MKRVKIAISNKVMKYMKFHVACYKVIVLEKKNKKWIVLVRFSLC